jgi:filamentous hemagglutinin family protein
MTTSNCRIKLLTISFLTGLINYNFTLSSVAQIVPDNSLGGENSIVTPNVPLGNGETNRIDGGAIRDNNIFHSFQEFNVNHGQQVHFANPAGIENIIGRVTGLNISEILGTLGVLGNGNLFLLNPNGFIFGPNAQLDIQGSFVASSSESLLLGNGIEFSATNPQPVPLLRVSVNPGLGDWINPTGAIANEGNLHVGNNLTLMGKSLNLEGQLQAGGNLTLKAVDNVQIRDDLNKPFIATSGNQLLIQGNQLVDIFALNDPRSGLFAGGDLILRSQNTIITDAYFSSGGNFRLENLNQNLGNATSPNDPIIRSGGDVSFNSYTGSSLHIFAGGSVNIDTIEITGTDPENGLQEIVTLSDGVTIVAINGSTQPTLDIRAGTTNIEPRGIQGANQGFSSLPDTNGTGTRADIKINQIINPGGLVFLSNQDRPNSSLSGNIQVGLIDLSSDADGGSVVVDSRGRINVDQLIEVSGFGGNGGDVQLLAQDDIFFPVEAQVFSYGFEGVSGNITLKSQSTINVSYIESITFGEGIGGDINLTASKIFLGDTSLTEPPESGVGLIAAVLLGNGQGGNVNIEADLLEISGIEVDVVTADESIGNSGNLSIDAKEIYLKNNSFIFAVAVSANGGNTGDINILTNDLTLSDGSQINSQVLGTGNSGKININAKNSINLRGTFGLLPSAIVTDVFPDAIGNGGVITIKTGSLNLSEGGQIRASTNGNGNAGSIFINAKEITMDGAVLTNLELESELIPSAIVSEVTPTAIGDGNTIDITTENLTVTNGAFISASTEGMGNAGSINLKATKSAIFSGLFANENLEESQPSGAFVGVLEGAIGKGGTLKITTPELYVTDGSQLEALTEDSGNAGNIEISQANKVFLSGSDTGLFSNTTETSTGNAGNIAVDSQGIEIKDNAAISVDSQGTGIGGSISLRGDNLFLDNQARISATTASTDGGNITLIIDDAILLRRESNIATDAGTAGAGGDGGNIEIVTPFIIAPPLENSDITANAFKGNGGNIDITTNALFGIEFREEQTPLSDITASSQFGLAGTVVINNPDVDPTSGLVELPDQTTDKSDRIIVGCAAEGNSFTVTGRGGLPEDPTATIRGQTVLPDLRDFSESDSKQNLPPVQKKSRQHHPTSIVQVKGWIVNKNGEVELVAALPQESSFFKHPNCQDLGKEIESRL